MDAQGDTQIIRAQIPYMEITNYETQLRSATGGEGSYSVEPSHYDVLPHKIAETIIARSKKADDDKES
jgi:elongation factor G